MSGYELLGLEGKDLRDAMQVVMPQVPRLSEELTDNPLAIRGALLGQFALSEEPKEAEAIFDQVECTTIMGATGRTINDYMIGGSGRNAYFKVDPNPEKGDDLFYGLMFHIASHVQQLPHDEPWTLPAGDRFNELITICNSRPAIPAPEGRRSFDLMRYGQSLRMMGLLSNLNGLVRLVNKLSPEKPDTKVRTAHDLAYLVLSRASINGVGMFNENMEQDPLDMLEGEIVDLPSGVAIFKPSSQEVWRDMYPRAPEYAPPTLKCPLHQRDVFNESTPLKDQLHAGITSAHEDFDAFNT